MAYDPCLTVADPGGPVHVTHHARVAHHIVGRIRHRVHHAHNVSNAAATVPSDACGKHLPGKPLAKVAFGKPAVIGAASLLGAAGVAGAIVPPHAFVSPPGGPIAPGLPPPVITVPPVTVVTPPPPVSVPEPSSIVLFLAAVAVALIARQFAGRRLA